MCLKDGIWRAHSGELYGHELGSLTRYEQSIFSLPKNERGERDNTSGTKCTGTVRARSTCLWEVSGGVCLWSRACEMIRDPAPGELKVSPGCPSTRGSR